MSAVRCGQFVTNSAILIVAGFGLLTRALPARNFRASERPF